MTTPELIEKLTPAAIMSELGVSMSSVKEAKRNGFPASWFDPLERLGKREGVPVPRELFNWRTTTRGAA